ncbi:MAG: HsdM family class I SAM-dependent methyltransferase [Promethearchaeota archaeon]
MKDKEKKLSINSLYETILNSLEIGDHKKKTACLSSIPNIESNFLRMHHNRKKEGAFYTRDSIADFIVTQGLILFLNNYLKKYKIDTIDEIYKLNKEERNKIKERLLNLRVLDPACGTGVFLLSAIKIIVELLRTLEPDEDYGNIKFHVYKNLFGSEINPSARKLCILKLFSLHNDRKNSNDSTLLSILNSNITFEDSLERKKDFKFDLIIGNPPYGNILDNNQKAKLKSENIFYNDVYCAFLLKSLNWTNGIIGYLVPKSFLLRQGYVKFRQNLFSKANLLKIYDVGPNLFAKATNEVQILFYENKKDMVKDIEVYQYPNTEIVEYTAQKVDALRVCFSKTCPLSVHAKKIYAYIPELNCPYCNSKTIALNRIRIKPDKKILNLINKIEKSGDVNYLNIERIPDMIRGEEAKGLKQVRALIEENTLNSCYFIKAKEDFTYYYFTKEKSFDIEKADPRILKGSNFEFYTHPKLLIKHNSIFPQSVFSKENVCFTSSIYSIISDDHVELKYINAILNSSLMQYYCLYGINNQQNTTINLNQYMIRHLPIKNASPDQKETLSEKVQEVINALQNSNGNLNQKIIPELRQIEDIIFEIYEIDGNEREMIVSDIKNRISFYQKIYQ